jgi:hypothetical protein
MTTRIMVLILAAVAWGVPALATSDPAGDLFNPFGGQPGAVPDLLAASAVRTPGHIELTLTCTATVYPADDFDHGEQQLTGWIDLGVGDDGSASDGHKDQWYWELSDLNLSAYLSLDEVAGGTISLRDDHTSLIGYIPITFADNVVTVAVPETLLPGRVDCFAVLVHDPDFITWDVLPNGRGHAEIAPEPSMLCWWVACALGWSRRRR